MFSVLCQVIRRPPLPLGLGSAIYLVPFDGPCFPLLCVTHNSGLGSTYLKPCHFSQSFPGFLQGKTLTSVASLEGPGISETVWGGGQVIHLFWVCVCHLSER